VCGEPGQAQLVSNHGVPRVVAVDVAPKYLRAWLEEVLIPRFTHRFLPVDPAVAHRWSECTAAARASGRRSATAHRQCSGWFAVPCYLAAGL